MSIEQKKTVKIFYSYAHEDKALRDELEKHLQSLKRSGMIASWHDHEISLGTEWERAFHHNYESAGSKWSRRYWKNSDCD